MRFDDLRALLACPVCGAAIDGSEAGLACSGCRASYAVTGGVPSLLAPDSQRELAALRDAWGGQRLSTDGNRELVALARRLLPPAAPFLNLVSGPNLARIGRELDARALLLDLGSGGGEGAGMQRLDRDLLAERTVFLDVGAWPGVSLVGDAVRLPLRDASFDAVLLKAVLEHVPDAAAVVAEARRVLKPGGLLYAEIPFLYEFHPNPGDYVRFTSMGLEQLFASFVDVEVGTLIGPAAALASLTTQILAFCLSLGNLALRKGLVPILSWLTWPLALPDLLLVRLRDARIVAHHLFVLARKPR